MRALTGRRSLRDARHKMSKSSGARAATLYLDDSADELAAKVQRATTDSLPGISYDAEQRPHVANLLRIFAAVTDSDPHAVAARYAASDKAQFKAALTEALETHLRPIRQRIASMSLADVELVLREGRDCAREVAAANYEHIRVAMGMSVHA